MNIIIEAPFTLSDTDKVKIKSKIKDLEKFESRMTQVNVFFKDDDGNKPNDILAEIIIRVPGNDLFAENTDKDAMKAFSGVYNTIKRMAKKRREVMNTHQSPIKKLNNIVNDNL